MKRSEFFKRLGFGAIGIVLAPEAVKALEGEGIIKTDALVISASNNNLVDGKALEGSLLIMEDVTLFEQRHILVKKDNEYYEIHIDLDDDNEGLGYDSTILSNIGDRKFGSWCYVSSELLQNTHYLAIILIDDHNTKKANC